MRMKTTVMTISYKAFNIWKLNRKYMQDVAHTGNAPYVTGKEMVYTVNVINSITIHRMILKLLELFLVYVAILHSNTHLFCQSVKAMEVEACPVSNQTSIRLSCCELFIQTGLMVCIKVPVPVSHLIK